MIELYVNNELLDIDTDTDFSMSFQVKDFATLNFCDGDFSYEFELPATIKNLRLTNRSNTINAQPYSEIPCVLKSGTIRKEGFLQVTGFADRISVNFFSGNSNWIAKLGEKKLSDLDLSFWDHLYTGAVVRNSFTQTEGYVYLLCDSDGLSDISTVLDVISHTDLMPGIYVHTVVTRIFNELGYKIAGGFLDSPDYKRLVLPYVKLDFCNSGQYYKDRSLKVGRLTDYVANTIQTIPWTAITRPYWEGEFFYSTSYYQPTDTHTVDVVAYINVTARTGAGAKKIDIMLNAGSIATVAVIASTSYTLTVTGQQVISGDQIYIRLTNVAGEDMTIDTTSYFHVTTPPAIQSGDFVAMSEMMPDLLQADLISYLLCSFGVVPSYNEYSKTITFEKFYSIKTSAADDWSEKYVNSYEFNFFEYVSNYSKVNRLLYQELDDAENLWMAGHITLLSAYFGNWLTSYQSRNNKLFGEGKFSIVNDFISGTNDIYEAPFAPSWWDQVTVSAKNAWLMRYVRDDIPRIALCIAACDHLYFNDFGAITVSGTACHTFAYPYFTKYMIGTALDNVLLNLSYSEVTWPGAGGINLIDRYWRDFVEILQDPKILRAKIKLTETDILNLDFLKPKYIKGENITGYYFLNKISDYRFNNEPVECELIKI